MSKTAMISSLRPFFRFPFEGPEWQKRFLIGAGLILAGFVVPLIPLVFVLGYVLQVMRRAATGEDLELPPWDDWGQLALDGLRSMLIGLVYLGPGFLVFYGGMALYVVASLALPLGMELGGAAAEQWLLAFFLVAMAIMFLSMAGGLVLTVLGAIPMPVASVHFAVEGELGAAFRVREWWAILKANRWGFLIAWLLVAGLMTTWYLLLMLAYYSVVLCCLLPIAGAPAGLYLILVSAALFGHAYREGTAAESPAIEMHGA